MNLSFSYVVKLIMKSTGKGYAEAAALLDTAIQPQIVQHDQQRLDAALAAWPEKPNIKVTELPSNPNEANEVLQWARGKGEAIDQCKAALTAALAPDNFMEVPKDNSSVEENK